MNRLVVHALAALLCACALALVGAAAASDAAEPTLQERVRQHVGDGKPFILHVRVRVPEDVDAAQLEALVRLNRANREATASEPGAVYFNFLYEPQELGDDGDPSAARRLLVLEHWSSRADWEAHLKHGHTRQNMAMFSELGCDVDLRLYVPLTDGNPMANLFGKKPLTMEPATSHLDRVRETVKAHWDFARPLTVLTELPVTASADDAARTELADIAAVTSANAERLTRFVVAVGAEDPKRVLVWQEWPDILAYAANADTPRDKRLHEVFNRYGAGRRMTRVYVDPDAE